MKRQDMPLVTRPRLKRSLDEHQAQRLIVDDGKKFRSRELPTRVSPSLSIMSGRQHQRKRAFNRGTFLLVDGEKYDVSNIVHESTELIPDEVTVVIRQSTLPQFLYPRLDNIDDYLEEERESDDASLEQQRHAQRRDSESLSSHNDTSASSYAAEDDDEGSWSQRHQSLSSINWTPPEKKELLKMVERSGGRAQVPGAVHVDNDEQQQQRQQQAPSFTPRKPPPNMVREESTPGAIHIDGPGIGESPSFSARQDSLNFKPPALVMDTKQSVAAAYGGTAAIQNSYSMDSYFETTNNHRQNSWDQQQRQQQQQQHDYHRDDDDSWSSAQIRAAASAFDACEIRAKPQHHSEQRMVQVTEELELPLHGASETSAALETGNVVTAVCLVCRATLRCISKAQYVLCPECKCLTPLQDTHLNALGGVGLGLLSTYDPSFHVGAS